jgi:hypothetical protein
MSPDFLNCDILACSLTVATVMAPFISFITPTPVHAAVEVHASVKSAWFQAPGVSSNALVEHLLGNLTVSAQDFGMPQIEKCVDGLGAVGAVVLHSPALPSVQVSRSGSSKILKVYHRRIRPKLQLQEVNTCDIANNFIEMVTKPLSTILSTPASPKPKTRKNISPNFVPRRSRRVAKLHPLVVILLLTLSA